MRYRIKDEVWMNFLQKNNISLSKPNPGFLEAKFLPSHPPFDDAVQLVWPVWWWKMSEVEIETT